MQYLVLVPGFSETTGGCRAPRVLELSSDTLPTFSAEGGSTEQTFDSSFQKPENTNKRPFQPCHFPEKKGPELKYK
jgi:hypothetical protein